jgi:N-carbamoylputrescine amidase
MAEPIPGPTTEQFSKLAKKHGVVVVLNLFERDGERTYDASPVIDADGKLLGVTRMVHIMEGPGFHEKGYYAPGENINFVYKTKVGRVGIAICYDRHFPEYMRCLGLKEAEIVVIPQAGALGEWTEGIFEAELQVVVDPHGRIIAQAPKEEDHILYADCDFQQIPQSHAKKHFLQDRRPDFYRVFDLLD